MIFRDFTEELMFLKINRYTKINSVIFVLRLFLRIMIQMFLIKKNYIYRICIIVNSFISKIELKTTTVGLEKWPTNM